jgi:hypothetical protein
MAQSKNYGQTGVASSLELGKGGARVRDNSGVVEARNNADNALAKVSAADPTDESNLVTLGYLRRNANVSVTGQINGGSPPLPPAVGTMYVCTTSGGSYTVNRLYYSTGSTWEEKIPPEGMTIVVTDALSGGSVEFLADHVYVWDLDGNTWDDIGPAILTSSKQLRQRSVNFTYTSGALNVGATVPENGRVLSVTVAVTQIFNGTAPTLIVGDAGDVDRHVASDEVDLKTVGVYVNNVSHLYGSETQITALLVPDSSGTGVGNITVVYAEA